MVKVAIIGGTGLTALPGLEIMAQKTVTTPYGEPSSSITQGALSGKEVFFLPRHGAGHTIAPHKINYRANIWALQSLGVEKVIAVAAVGGIAAAMPPGALAIPDQIIDYTGARISTFFEEDLSNVVHIDFTYPYCEELRRILISAAGSVGLQLMDYGTYGATQGPRLETAAEITRLERDGCHMVGMTGMPEAALARELGLCYATCALSANWAAGKTADIITMEEIEKNLGAGIGQVRQLLQHALLAL